MAETQLDSKNETAKVAPFQDPFTEDDTAIGETFNASGHPQELDRSFNLLSLCGVGIVADNAWGAGGGSLVLQQHPAIKYQHADNVQIVAMYNGGPPGVLWEL